MADLFPSFSTPKIINDNKQTDNIQKSSIYFDFEKGDFRLNNGGSIETAMPYDSWVQWCLKTVYTQRYSFMSYSNQVGVEIEEAFMQETQKEQESYIEKTITEALLADPYQRTKRVYDFNFEWGVDKVNVTFWVSGIWDKSELIHTNLKKGR